MTRLGGADDAFVMPPSPPAQVRCAISRPWPHVAGPLRRTIMKLTILAPLAALSLVAAPSLAATKHPTAPKHAKHLKASRTATTTTAKPKSAM